MATHFQQPLPLAILVHKAGNSENIHRSLLVDKQLVDIFAESIHVIQWT